MRCVRAKALMGSDVHARAGSTIFAREKSHRTGLFEASNNTLSGLISRCITLCLNPPAYMEEEEEGEGEIYIYILIK